MPEKPTPVTAPAEPTTPPTPTQPQPRRPWVSPHTDPPPDES